MSESAKHDQYKQIESILDGAGAAGVHRAVFLYEYHWSQIGARIHEMNDAGWFIESVPLPRSQWLHGVKTKYVLRSRPLRSGEDWYERLHGPRPSHPWKKPFSEKRQADADCFELTAPEPRR